ncbi:MAG: ATP-dependent RNA helicase DbpA [Candidatus Thiothrix moscowensis]|nr:ATP-dependent RNA helicase DbpA [Candidatus Thiothrix moscowensis]
MSTAFTTLNLPEAQLSNLNNLGYQKMTAIQSSALPHALQGADLIAQAKTGSGKTAVFAITLLAKLDPQNFAAQALVLCPTRELSTQVANEIRRLARYQPNIKVVTLTGGQPLSPQAASLEHGAHVIVGTPGRINDHIGKRTLDLSNIHTLVLDEADRMLEMGFMEDISKIIRLTPAYRQTLLFSATYPDDIKALSKQFQRNPVQVKAETLHQANAITQHSFLCQKHERLPALETLLAHFKPRSAVIFCNMKVEVREITEHLQQRGFSVKALHGEMEQRDRDEVFVQFKHHSFNFLIATDVAARGLDIEDLPCVINYELPHDPDIYIHRVGRTGRAGKEGLALNLLTDAERHKLTDIGIAQQTELDFEVISAIKCSTLTPRQPPNMTLCIAAGRKEKVRPGDILGALTGDGGIDGKAVGKIDVLDYAAYVAIERSVAKQAVTRLANGTIKGRKFKVKLL